MRFPRESYPLVGEHSLESDFPNARQTMGRMYLILICPECRADSSGHKRNRQNFLPEEEHMNEPYLRELIFGELQVKPSFCSLLRSRPNKLAISSLQSPPNSAIGIENVTAVAALVALLILRGAMN